MVLKKVTGSNPERSNEFVLVKITWLSHHWTLGLWLMTFSEEYSALNSNKATFIHTLPHSYSPKTNSHNKKKRSVYPELNWTNWPNTYSTQIEHRRYFFFVISKVCLNIFYTADLRQNLDSLFAINKLGDWIKSTNSQSKLKLKLFKLCILLY